MAKRSWGGNGGRAREDGGRQGGWRRGRGLWWTRDDDPRRATRAGDRGWFPRDARARAERRTSPSSEALAAGAAATVTAATAAAFSTASRGAGRGGREGSGSARGTDDARGASLEHERTLGDLGARGGADHLRGDGLLLDNLGSADGNLRAEREGSGDDGGHVRGWKVARGAEQWRGQPRTVGVKCHRGTRENVAAAKAANAAGQPAPLVANRESREKNTVPDSSFLDEKKDGSRILVSRDSESKAPRTAPVGARSVGMFLTDTTAAGK